MSTEAPKTQPLGTGGDMHFAFSFAAQAAEVEVNTITGEVRVLRVIAANDVGTAVNPLGLQGQVEGGVMMGLGNCLTEEFIVENGYVVTDHLARYRVPGIMLTPEIISIIVEASHRRRAVRRQGRGRSGQHSDHARHHERHLQCRRRARGSAAGGPGEDPVGHPKGCCRYSAREIDMKSFGKFMRAHPPCPLSLREGGNRQI